MESQSSPVQCRRKVLANFLLISSFDKSTPFPLLVQGKDELGPGLQWTPTTTVLSVDFLRDPDSSGKAELALVSSVSRSAEPLLDPKPHLAVASRTSDSLEHRVQHCPRRARACR